MADAKLTALTELASPSNEDLLYIVDDPGGTPTSKKITVANLLAGAGAPINASYVTEDANATLTNESVLGSAVITSAAYASRQAAAKAGRLFLPNNSFYLERDTGAAWVPWGPLFPLTQPVDGDYSWVTTQGGASVSATKGGIYISTPASAGDTLRCRGKATPSVPYTITALILPNLHPVNFLHIGIFFRRNAAGAGQNMIHTLQFASGNGDALGIQVTQWTDATTYLSDFLSATLWPIMGPLFLRIADDNTNRIYSVSSDGQNFRTVYTHSRTTDFTPDQVGFFVNANHASQASSGTLLSWAQA